MRPSLTRRAALPMLAAALSGVRPARAQAYPVRPVRVVVPYAAGGGADTVSRILFQRVGELLGQNFAIENRPGGAGTIGAANVATAEPDGYTVLYDATAHSVNPALLAKVPYDTLKAFRPVFLSAVVPNVLLAHGTAPERTVADVIATARATPGGPPWASSGMGSAQHLALELFRRMAGVPVNHVPYRGGGPALNDLLGKQVQFFFSNTSSSIGYIQSGALRAVAHTSLQPVTELPGIPAVAETLPGFEALEWNGVFLPAAAPDAIVARLNQALNDAVATPAIRDRLSTLTVTTRQNTPDEFGSFVRSEIEKWGRVVREAGIRIE